MTAPIRLSVPGTLAYRTVAVRVVAEAARLVSSSKRREPDNPLTIDVTDPFDTAVVSAFMEIFNNVVLHAYSGTTGTIELAITPGERQLTIEIADTGTPFDMTTVAPLPDVTAEALPEGGMGIHIAKAMLDEVSYQPGPPNRWRLLKRS
jgi:anti-sigma regulatory factor (Ser/Thr protein kinase)